MREMMMRLGAEELELRQAHGISLDSSRPQQRHQNRLHRRNHSNKNMPQNSSSNDKPQNKTESATTASSTNSPDADRTIIISTAIESSQC